MKKFKLVTLLGIRPDIIRMFKLIKLLDGGQKKYGYKHIFAHSGQHFDYELDEVFYRQLGVRKPDVNFSIGKTLKESGGSTTHAYQTALLFQKVATFLEKEKPNAVMFLGDTNTVLASVVVSKYTVPVIHIEGGGRSFDWRMPEEKNRITIDHLSDAIYCYLPRYKKVLLKEGIEDFRIKIIGNIIYDAIEEFLPKAKKTNILSKLKVNLGEFALVTLHREENTSDKEILSSKVKDIIKLSKKMPVVFPIMPRVEKNLVSFGLNKKIKDSKVIVIKPLGFLEFLHLESCAKVIITDSGTVQEEALILGVPCLVSRLSTERPETIIAGASILSDKDLYKNALKALKLKKNWDRGILNPSGRSPSEIVFKDLISKIKSNYFEKSRKYAVIKGNYLAREAHGEFNNVRNKK